MDPLTSIVEIIIMSPLIYGYDWMDFMAVDRLNLQLFIVQRSLNTDNYERIFASIKSQRLFNGLAMKRGPKNYISIIDYKQW